MSGIWAFDIGGTHVRAGWFADTAGQLHETKRWTWSGQTLDSDLSDLDAILSECRAAWGEPLAVGISIAAMLSLDQNRVVAWPNRPWWQEFDLNAHFQKRINARVQIEDDASSAALGELHVGAARGEQHAFMVTVGTGVGGGLVSAGRLLRGAHGWAGDFGHIRLTMDGPACTCGRTGCLQAWASGPALLRTVREEDAMAASMSPAEIHTALRLGESWTRSAVARVTGYLALGIANAVRLFDPAVVVIGGGVAQSVPGFAELCQEAVQQELGQHPARHIAVVLSKLGDDAGLYGAFSLVNHE